MQLSTKELTYFSEERSFSGTVNPSDFGFPVMVENPKTGNNVSFLEDVETMRKNEYFDGEGVALYSPEYDVNLMIWFDHRI